MYICMYVLPTFENVLSFVVAKKRFCFIQLLSAFYFLVK
jgi:hypothetical protein